MGEQVSGGRDRACSVMKHDTRGSVGTFTKSESDTIRPRSFLLKRTMRLDIFSLISIYLTGVHSDGLLCARPQELRRTARRVMVTGQFFSSSFLLFFFFFSLLRLASFCFPFQKNPFSLFKTLEFLHLFLYFVFLTIIS